MISVQNHLRPLNGNKYLILILIGCLSIISCNTQKKAGKSNTNRPPVTTAQTNLPKAKSKVDTIQWVEENIDYTTSPMTDQPVDIRNAYNVCLFMPFNSDSYSRDKLDTKGTSEFRFVNYYAGVKLALAELKNMGTNLNVQIQDSEANDFSTKLRAQENADVIIGPYKRDQLKLTAEFCKRNEIVNVSPWQASSKIAQNNPFHIQLRPNQTAYYDAMITDALDKFKPDQIIMLGRNEKKDEARIRHFQKTASALLRMDAKSTPLNNFAIEVDSLHNDATTYDEIFDEERTTVFVLPQWSSEDENFIYNCLRKLAIEKGDRRVVVYGMPVMLDSDKITFDYFQNLDIHVARAKWVDRKDEKVLDFRQKYFDTYNALPSDDALDGYDMMKFVGSNLLRNGKTFQYTLSEDDQRYLQTKFDIQKVHVDGNSPLDNFSNINYFENINLDIIHFENDRLVRN